MTILQLFSNLAEYHGLEYEFSEKLELLYSLDFEETGLVIRDILNKRYPDGITGLENVEVQGNTIMGIFLDQISPMVTKKFNFSINGDTGKVVFEQIDTGNLDYSEVSFATKKSQTCTKGKSFGCTRDDGTIYCLPLGRKCATSKKLDPIEIKAVREIVKKAPKAEKVVKPKAEKVVKPKAEKVVKPKAEKIKTNKYTLNDEKDFEDAILNKFSELSSKYNGLVPIYQLRRELGETIPRDKFNNYMLNMQGNDLLQFKGGSVEDSARDKIADSLHTELDGTRTYAQIGDGLTKESLNKRVADTKDRVNEALKDKKQLSDLGTAGALANGPKIKNQKEFDDAVEESSNRLNNEFIMGGIVPLEKIRKSLGDRVSKEEFDSMIFDHINNKNLNLGEQKDPTKEELINGVKDAFGGIKTYLAVSSKETKSKDLVESKYPKSPEERYGDFKPTAKEVAKEEAKPENNREDKPIVKESTNVAETDNRNGVEGKKTEFAEKWKKTWESAPSDLKEVLRRIDEPGEIISNSGTAYYSPSSSSINMNGYDPNANGSDRGASVYAHEYGHHIDSKAMEILGEKSLNSKLKAEGIPSIGELRQLGDSDEDTSIYADSMSKIKKILGVEDSQLITLSDIVKLANGSQYISSSKEGKEAFNADDQRLNELDQAGKSGKSQNDRDLRKSNLLDTTKEIAKEKALVELRKKNKKITALNSSDDHRKLVDKYQREASLDILGNSNTLVSKLITDKTDIVTINKLILDGVHPEAIANLTEDYLREIGKNADRHVHDLIGSITKNKVGKGHSDDYYESGVENANTEAFANIIALHRLGNPVINEVLDYLAPNGHKFVKKILKDLIND